MKEYAIISDGSCDISFAEAKNLNIEIVPFNIEFNKETYKEGLDISVRDFYELMIKHTGIFPKTSLPTVHDYQEVFRKYSAKDIDIICLCITTKFSGSFNSARMARDLVLEDYPEARITIIDTTVNTVLQGLVVREAVRLRGLGYSYDSLVEAIEKKKATGRIFFTVKDLTYLQNGGRIGKVASIIGNILKISPLITLKDGEIFSSGKAISRVRSLASVKKIFRQYLEENKALPEDYVLTVGYGYDIEEGSKFRDQLEQEFTGFKFGLDQIGATIACHTGPHPLGIGILKKLDK